MDGHADGSAVVDASPGVALPLAISSANAAELRRIGTGCGSLVVAAVDDFVMDSRGAGCGQFGVGGGVVFALDDDNDDDGSSTTVASGVEVVILMS